MSGDGSILRGIIPLDEPGKLAFIDTEIAQVFLITIEDARFVPASSQDTSPK